MERTSRSHQTSTRRLVRHHWQFFRSQLSTDADVHHRRRTGVCLPELRDERPVTFGSRFRYTNALREAFTGTSHLSDLKELDKRGKSPCKSLLAIQEDDTFSQVGSPAPKRTSSSRTTTRRGYASHSSHSHQCSALTHSHIETRRADPRHSIQRLRPRYDLLPRPPLRHPHDPLQLQLLQR